jgi:hypothetical protein
MEGNYRVSLGQRSEAQEKTAMSKLICRRGGSRYIYDEDVEQVDEIKAKMTNISLQTFPDFESCQKGVRE